MVSLGTAGTITWTIGYYLSWHWWTVCLNWWKKRSQRLAITLFSAVKRSVLKTRLFINMSSQPCQLVKVAMRPTDTFPFKRSSKHISSLQKQNSRCKKKKPVRKRYKGWKMWRSLKKIQLQREKIRPQAESPNSPFPTAQTGRTKLEKRSPSQRGWAVQQSTYLTTGTRASQSVRNVLPLPGNHFLLHFWKPDWDLNWIF